MLLQMLPGEVWLGMGLTHQNSVEKVCPQGAQDPLIKEYTLNHNVI